MNKNNKNDTTHKSEINATIAFTQSLCVIIIILRNESTNTIVKQYLKIKDMRSTNYISNAYRAKERKLTLKGLRKLNKVIMCNKLVLITSFIFFLSINVKAQKGPFVRFSLGPGFFNEYSTINGSGFTYAAKNHAIGWGFNDKYAVYFSEFGAFSRKDIGVNYQFINLDAYGLGLAYNTENNISFHASGAYGTVHFSDSWKEQGDFIQDGYAIAFGIDKKWALSKRFELGMGPLMSFFKTTNYTFTNFSLNFWLDFYLFPQN